jgi:PAS domain S-box-containing protein
MAKDRIFRRNSLSLIVGAGSAIALLSINVAITSRNIQKLETHNRQIAQDYEIISNLRNLVSLAKDAETGQRGFIITGRAAYLEPYDRAVENIKEALETVDRLTTEDAQQQARIPDLQDRIDKKLNELEKTIVLRQSVGFEAAQQVVLSGQGKQEMDELRVIIDEMIQARQEVLQVRSQQAERTYHMAIFTGLLSGLTALATLLGFLITLRKYLNARDQTAIALAEQAENLRITLASIGDAVITTDADGRITNMNTVAESLTGWTHSEAIGQPLQRVFHIINENSRQPVESPVTKALTQGTVVGLANHTMLIDKNGVEHPIDDSAAPIRVQAGNILGCVLVFRDVTERRQQEKQLRKEQKRLQISEQRFRQIADTMPQMVWVARPDGYHEYYNRRWYDYIGAKPEESAGAGWNTPLHPTDQPLAIDRWQHSLRTGEPYEIEYRFRSKEGDYRWFLGRALPVRDEAGQITQWFGTCTDIEESKRLEAERSQLAAELSEADRRKDEFLATLAHELRNPLAPIRNGLKILRLAGQNTSDPNHSNPPSHEATERIQAMMERQIAQMVRLVDELMDVSRISRGKVALSRKQVEIASIIEQAVETSRPAIDLAQQRLIVTLPPKPIHLQADPLRLVQVFSNLLNNACKYSQPGSQILVTVDLIESNLSNSENSALTISVKDTGIGISAEMLPKIFTLFTQVEGAFERASGSSSPAQNGLGIGLTLVKQLVEMHGGSVQAYSEGLGKGSEFTVQLPIAIEPTATEPIQNKTPNHSEPPAMSPRRILIVDDNEDSAVTLSVLFEMSGDDTQTAEDGLKAVAAAEAFRPDVALLDIGLPGLNGYEVAEAIRAQPWGKTMVLVALTGWGQDEDRKKSKAAGFDAHMVKPVDHEALLALLDELIEARLEARS